MVAATCNTLFLASYATVAEVMTHFEEGFHLDGHAMLYMKVRIRLPNVILMVLIGGVCLLVIIFLPSLALGLPPFMGA